MDDHAIVALYHQRTEDAISESEKKYGAYLRAIALRILENEGDAEECVSDTYLRAWDAIPPHKPERLSTFLGKIARNLALNRYAHTHAQKRSGAVSLILDEVAELIPDPQSELPAADAIHLHDCVNRFLASLPARVRILFVRRYWFLDPVKQIAADLGMSESSAKVTLMRTRTKLKAFLEAEGIQV